MKPTSSITALKSVQAAELSRITDRDGLLHMLIKFRLEAFWIAARLRLLKSNFSKQQWVVAGALRAIDAGTCLGEKLRIFF